jgi:NAD(P)-dependent dehydrogenase (short-subunit alcohol dehydrogenase family)
LEAARIKGRLMMDRRKIALITGASSGIGKSIALALLKEGYEVYGAARRLEKMAEIKDAGGKVISLDVTSEVSISAAVDQIVKESGGVDVLINNAGYGTYGAVEDVPVSEGRRQFEVNLFGLAEVTKRVLPGMRERGFGKIINISSMGGRIYMPLGAWYHASKHALEGFSDCLRFETEPFGIDVVIIEPGSIKTEWTGIATNSMLTYSGGTAYDGLARKASGLFSGTEGSDPQVITALVLKALRARRPKTRYAGGKYARLFLLLRRLLPDRLFDGLLRSQTG